MTHHASSYNYSGLCKLYKTGSPFIFLSKVKDRRQEVLNILIWRQTNQQIYKNIQPEIIFCYLLDGRRFRKYYF